MQTFSSLKNNNFRLWFVGSSFAIFGNWVQMAALGFLVYDLTHSAFYLGLTGFAPGISAWFFTLYAGAVADHVPRRTILLWTQASAMLIGAILAYLTFTHLIQPIHIVAISFFMGAIAAFESPARQAIVAELVTREHYGNAIALNSCLFNTGTMFGPAISGVLYMTVGPSWCFAINSLTYIPFIGALLAIKIPKNEHSSPEFPGWSGIKEGVDYSFKSPLIRPILAMVAVISAFGFSIFSLMPAWAVSVLHGNAGTNGWLQSARGVGALIGALTLASVKRWSGKVKILCLGALIYPLLLFGFAFTNSLIPALVITTFIGGCFIMVYNSANTILQSNVPDPLRGRVMSIYMLSFLGTAPAGSLLGGYAATIVGERWAAIACALTAIALIFPLVLIAPEFRRPFIPVKKAEREFSGSEAGLEFEYRR
jgi:MFS family permease